MSNLPATMNNLVNALETATTVATESTGDMAFLRLAKDGKWVFGGDDSEVTEDSLWAVNPESFAMGFQSWSIDGELLGEEMALVTEPPVLKSNLPEVNGDWKQMLSCHMVCIEGEEEGLRIQYSTTSKGGVKAINALMQTLVKRIKSPDADGKVVPVLTLDVEFYKHKKYGKIYTPILNVQKWIDSGDTSVEAEPEKIDEEEVVEEVVEEKAPARRRRSRAA